MAAILHSGAMLKLQKHSGKSVFLGTAPCTLVLCLSDEMGSRHRRKVLESGDSLKVPLRLRSRRKCLSALLRTAGCRGLEWVHGTESSSLDSLAVSRDSRSSLCSLQSDSLVVGPSIGIRIIKQPGCGWSWKRVHHLFFALYMTLLEA